MDAAIFDRAVDEILRRGLAQGSMINRDGAVCVAGALALASGLTGDELLEADYDDIRALTAEPLDVLARVVRDRQSMPGLSAWPSHDVLATVYCYSDTYIGTEDEAVGFLQAAKAKAESA